MNATLRVLQLGLSIVLLGATETGAVTVCASGCDFDKIRSAVNSGAALIEVLPGTYPSSESLVQLEGQALIGRGAERSDVVIVGDCVFGGSSLIRIANHPRRSTIRNLTFAQAAGCSFANGIIVAGDVSIDFVEVSGFPQTGTNGVGIVVANSDAEVLITDSDIVGNGIGINAGSALGVFFSNITNNRSSGINLFGPMNRNKYILGSRIADNGGRGVSAVVPVEIEDTDVAGNTLSGLDVELGASIRDSRIFDNLDTGVRNSEGGQLTMIGGAVMFNQVPMGSSAPGGVDCGSDLDAIITGTIIADNSDPQTSGCVSCVSAETRSCDTGFVGVTGVQTCGTEGSWGLCNADPTCADRETQSTCNDGVDNDCDSLVDDGDADCGAPGNPTNGELPSSGRSGDPINTFSGELYRQLAPDIDLGGPLRLHFSRYYASGLEAQGRSGRLGTNWRHNFEWQIVDAGTTVSLIDPMGRRIAFDLDGADWRLQDGIDVPYQLIEPAADSFILGDPRNGYSYHFANARLERINHGTSVSLTLGYSGANLSSVADDLGRQLSFTYNGALLASVDDGTRTVSFVHLGQLLSMVVDVRGLQTSYSYDGVAGRLLSWTRPEGNIPFVQNYDSNARVVTQTNASGQGWSLAYAAGSTTITDPLGNSMNHAHSARGELTEVVDEAGDAFQIGYERHRRDAIFDRRGGTTLIERHLPSGRPSRIVGADGAQAQLYYAPRLRDGLRYWNLAKARYPDGEEERYVWGARAPTLRVDRSGERWSSVFEERGLPIARSNPKGGSSAATYNADGTLSSQTDAAGNSTSYSYDPLRRLTTVTFADGSTRAYSWNEGNQLLAVTDERGNTRAWSYDDNGNPAAYSDPLAMLSSYGFDNDDRLETVTDPLGNTITLGYDPLSRLATVSDGSGRTSSFGYDARGRLSTITEPGGASWQSSFDAEGIISSVVNPLGHTTSFGADAMGRITTQTSPLGHVSSASYDPVGRVLNRISADGHNTDFEYDARGLLTAIDFQGATIGFAYDELGLRTAIIDGGGQSWPFGRDLLGRMTSVGDPLGRTRTIAYDNRHRVATVTYPGGLGTLDIDYDASGNPTLRDYSDGTQIAMSWDVRQLPVSGSGLSLAYDAAGRLNDSNGLAIVRDAAGRILSIDYDTGAASKLLTHAYDARGLLATLSDWLGGITSFSYDAAGRLTGITRPNGIHTSYSWDDDSRLIGISHGTLVSIELTLDSVGRTLAATRSAPLLPTVLPEPAGYSYDAASQITSSGYSHDALGRQTSGNGLTSSWDLASRLTRVVGSQTVDHSYDAFGMRITRSSAGQTREYLWNYALPLPMVAIVRDMTSDLRYDIHGPGGMLLYSLDAASGARRDYHYDELGNTLMLTDASGSAVASYAYGPYGELLASAGESGNPYTWLGQWGVMRDPANGLYYIRARWYSADDRRFLSRDRLPASHPLATSPYQYAFGNPLGFIDVNGREPEQALERLLDRYANLRVVIARLEKLQTELSSNLDFLDSGLSFHPNAPFLPSNVELLFNLTYEFAFELAYLDINFRSDSSITLLPFPFLLKDQVPSRSSVARNTYVDALKKVRQVLTLARQSVVATGPSSPSPTSPPTPAEPVPGWEQFLDEVDRRRAEATSEPEFDWGRETYYVLIGGIHVELPEMDFDPDGPVSIYNLPPFDVVAPYLLLESVREKSGLSPKPASRD